MEKQKLLEMKKKLEADRKLDEAKRKEEEKKRLEALQRKLEEQRKKEAQLQKEKWEAFATPPAVAKRTKKTGDSTTPVMDKKELGSQLKAPPSDDSWLLIDSPVPARPRLSTPPPRPQPYQTTSGSRGSSPIPLPRSRILTVDDVVIQPIRKPPQKAPISQKRVTVEDSVKPEKGGSGGGDVIKPESVQAGPQPTAPSNAVLKEKVRDMQEKRKVSSRMDTPQRPLNVGRTTDQPLSCSCCTRCEAVRANLYPILVSGLFGAWLHGRFYQLYIPPNI